jgi:translation elongation factor EF-G
MVEEVNEWREKLIEAVAEYNDDILERFFDNPESITKEEILETIRKATINMSIVPVLCGAAFKNKGVQRLLDAVVAFMPSPLDIGAVTGINPNTDKEESRKPEANEPFCGLAFKIATDPFVGRLAFTQDPSKVEAMFTIHEAERRSELAACTRCTPISKTPLIFVRLVIFVLQLDSRTFALAIPFVLRSTPLYSKR